MVQKRRAQAMATISADRRRDIHIFMEHAKIIKSVIDRLASMDAKAELRILSMRLQETAFRATEGGK